MLARVNVRRQRPLEHAKRLPPQPYPVRRGTGGTSDELQEKRGLAPAAHGDARARRSVLGLGPDSEGSRVNAPGSSFVHET
jgi:hypothetical protein